MKIYVGSDHAGYEAKEKLKEYLSSIGYEVDDKGPFSYNEDDDYPDFIKPVAEAVAGDKGSFGMIVGKTGQGEAMCANRVSGARAAEYYGGNNMEVIKLSREHNDANILSFAAAFLSKEEVHEAIEIFLNTPFSGDERHIRRISKF